MSNQKYWSKATNFIITNICNYNCPECNTFNNWTFHGNEQKWKEYKDLYAKWAELIDIGNYEICGGEATTNPDWINWVEGIHHLWPNNTGTFRTNGHLFQQQPDKFKKLQDLCNNSNGKLGLAISVHSVHDLERIDRYVDMAIKFLGPTWIPQKPGVFLENFIKTYNQIRGCTWPDINSIEDFESLPDTIKQECKNVFNFDFESQRRSQLDYILRSFKQHQGHITRISNHMYLNNAHNTLVELGTEHFFFESALEYVPEEEHFKLRHNSDPEKAHYGCQERCAPVGVGFSTMVFIKGKMYKCAISKLLNDFDQQFYINMSESDRKLIQNYVPASLDMTADDMDQWFENMHKKIALCKFCAEDYYSGRRMIEGGPKKMFIKKKQKSR